MSCNKIMDFKDNQILFLFSNVFLGCDLATSTSRCYLECHIADMKKFRKFVKYIEERLFI